MGWACRKSGIVLAHGQGLIGQGNMRRIEERCALRRR